MGRREGSAFLLLALFAFIGCSSDDATPTEREPLPPVAFDECVTRAQRIDVEGRRAYHDSLYAYVTDRAAEYEELARARRTHQLALLDVEQARFDHVLSSDPQRIKTDAGIPGFRNFRWDDADSAAMAAADPEYTTLESRIAEMSQANRDHPQARVFAEHFSVNLAKSRSYREIVEAWESKDEEVAALLKRCMPHGQAPLAE